MNQKISDLRSVDMEMISDSDPFFIPGMRYNRNASEKINVSSIVDMVKSSLGYLNNPIVKCGYCGQYGAVYCACPKCGAPIDPKEGRNEKNNHDRYESSDS